MCGDYLDHDDDDKDKGLKVLFSFFTLNRKKGKLKN